MHASSAAILIYLVFARRRILPFVPFVIGYAAMWVIDVLTYNASYQTSFVLVTGLLFCASLTDENKVYYAAAPVGGVLTGLSLFMKTDLGLAGLYMIGAYGLIWMARKGRKAWKAILLSWGSYLLTVAIVSKLCFQSYQNFADWIRAAMEIANGYSVAMSFVGSTKILGLALMALAIYAVLGFLLLRGRSIAGYVALMFAGPVFLAFKGNFCLQFPPRDCMFFSFLLAVLGVVILNAVSRKELRIGVISFLMVLAVALPSFAFHGGPMGTRVSRADAAILARTAWGDIDAVIHLDNARTQLDKQSQLNLEVDRLPSTWVDLIKSRNGTVDAIPWEISYCPANDLQWSPHPVLQVYCAFTSHLDRWSASHYMGDSAPDFLIVEFIGIFGHHPLFWTPAAWREIISNYQLVFVDWGGVGGGRLLLEKKIQPTEESLKVVSQQEVDVNQWVLVPRSSSLLFVDVDMRLTLLGTATKTLFRIPPINVDLIYDSGKSVSYRMIPDTARDGLLINYLPLNIEELSQLLTGVTGDTVKMFRISGPGTTYYNHEVDLTWKEMP
jgi:hypothetical protein